MAKVRRKPTGKSDRSQKFLPDEESETGDMRAPRIPAIERAVEEFVEARDQIAVWRDEVSKCHHTLNVVCSEHVSALSNGYFVEVDERKFKIELSTKSRAMVRKVKADKPRKGE